MFFNIFISCFIYVIIYTMINIFEGVYAMLKLNLKQIADNKFPNKNQFAKATGIQYPAVCKLYDGSTKQINFDTLEKICIALDCTPNDLFESDSKSLSDKLNTK